MRTILTLLGLGFFAFLTSSCEEEINDSNQIYSDGELIISQSLYETTKTESYTIKDVAVEGDSLKFTICSGGCSGESWTVRLVDSGAVAESFPEQRWAKVALANEELCKAYICREYSINISPLQTGSGKLSLHLEGWEKTILYAY